MIDGSLPAHATFTVLDTHRYSFGAMLFDYLDGAQGAYLPGDGPEFPLTWTDISGRVSAAGGRKVSAKYNNPGDDAG